jgi:hypothetical protein
MCHEYILSRYSDDYEARLKLMAGEERKRVLDELVKKMLQTDSMAEFGCLLSDGIQRGEISLKISNTNSNGCTELHDALLNVGEMVVNRAAKLQVFYTGEDFEQKIVWNGGNMYRTSTAPLQKLLVDLGDEATWLRIQERYKSKVSHVYRGAKCKCNRHGHSNDLPSYFAFGHNSLTSYLCAVPPSAWKEYKQNHPNCCGVASFSDMESFQFEVDRLNAKRARRQECENDPSKLKAAIKKTMTFRKGDRVLKRSRVAPCNHKGKGEGKGKHVSDGDDSCSDDSDRSDY